MRKPKNCPMQVFYDFKSLPEFPRKTAVALGNFDGTHLGHQKILRFLVEKAKKKRLTSLVVTFSPHPEKATGQKSVRLLQTLPQKLDQLKRMGIHTAFVLPFDRKFASLSSQVFVQNILADKFNAKAIIVGKNFRFGKNKEGTVSTLCSIASRFHFEVFCISSVSKNGRVISSSLIRDFIQKGQIQKANDLLGRPYEIEGTVVKGQSMGADLGFPTANIKTQNELLPLGVFLSTVKIKTQEYAALTNIGTCPTFNRKQLNIETHILGSQSDLYGKNLAIQFLKRIRDEKPFRSAAELQNQIRKDIKTALSFFQRHKKNTA